MSHIRVPIRAVGTRDGIPLPVAGRFAFAACRIVIAMLLSGCTLITSGRYQQVRINNQQNGRVYIDGLEFGTGPMVVGLKRNRDHYINVDRPGRKQHTIYIEKKFKQENFFPVYIVLPLVVGLAGAISNKDSDKPLYSFASGFVFSGLLLLPSLIIDWTTGAIFKLSPDTVDVPAAEAATDATDRKTIFEPPVIPAGHLQIAILEFEGINVSKSDAIMATELARVEFVKGGTFTVIEREQVERILAEQAFQQTGCTNTDCSVKIGKLLSAQIVVIGTFGKFQEEFYLILRLVNVDDGKVLFSGRTWGKTVDELNINSGELRDQIRRRFR